MKIFRPAPRRVRDTAFADHTAARLIERLRDIKRQDFAHALWAGAGPVDRVETMKSIGTMDVRAFPVDGDVDYFPFDEASLDLILVNGTLNAVNDLPGALIQMRRALKPDGVFLAALPGGGTLYELRESIMRVESAQRGGTAPRVHPMVDLQSFAGLLQRAGFALPVADGEREVIFYRDLKSLLRDIKNAGEGLALAQGSPYPGKHFWRAVAEDYREHNASEDGLLRASVEVIYAIGWGPAESQPKVLRPGAAQERLAGALGSVEVSLPDLAKP